MCDRRRYSVLALRERGIEMTVAELINLPYGTKLQGTTHAVLTYVSKSTEMLNSAGQPYRFLTFVDATGRESKMRTDHSQLPTMVGLLKIV
jgi:hypothetical protein